MEGGVGDDDVAAVAIEVGNCLFIDSARAEMVEWMQSEDLNEEKRNGRKVSLLCS